MHQWQHEPTKSYKQSHHDDIHENTVLHPIKAHCHNAIYNAAIHLQRSAQEVVAGSAAHTCHHGVLSSSSMRPRLLA